MHLDRAVRRKAVQSFAATSRTLLPDRAYLKLENVRGTFDASILSVNIARAEGVEGRESHGYVAGTVALFGLRRATVKDGQHAGEGLTFVLDVTPITDELQLAGALDVDSLLVSVVSDRRPTDNTEITIGRISLYRQGF